MKLKNRVGFIKNNKLGIDKEGGHYVYINKVNKDRKSVNVNVITSLDINKKDNSKFQINKIDKIRKGYIFPLIKHKGNNFTKWSGINKNSIKNVKVKDIDFSSKKFINDDYKSLINKFIK